MSLSQLIASTSLASQLAGPVVFAGRRLVPPKGETERPHHETNGLVLKNPAGGKKGGADQTERDIRLSLEASGRTYLELQAEDSTQIVGRGPLIDYLQQHPGGRNVFLLPTVKNRYQRIGRIAFALKILKDFGSHAPFAFGIGGDGTYWDMVDASLMSCGVDEDVAFNSSMGAIDELMKDPPFISAVFGAGGSVKDSPRILGAPSGDFGKFLGEAVSVSVPCPFAELRSATEAYTGVPGHTLSFGGSAETFRRGDLTRGGLFRGSMLNYLQHLLPMFAESFRSFILRKFYPSVPFISRQMLTGDMTNPIEPFLVSYRRGGGDVVDLMSREMIFQGVRSMARMFYNPRVPLGEGLAMMVLPEGLYGFAKTAAESVGRGFLKGIAASSRDVFFGDRILSLSEQQQQQFLPGDEVSGSFCNRHGESTDVRTQMNGLYIGDYQRFSIRVLPEYRRALAGPYSQMAQWKYPSEQESNRALLVGGICAFVAEEVFRHAGGHAGWALLGRFVLGAIMAAAAPYASLSGLAGSLLTVPFAFLVRGLADVFGLGPAGVEQLAESLTIFGGMKAAQIAASKRGFYKKFEYQVALTEKQSRLLGILLAETSALLLSGLDWFG